MASRSTSDWPCGDAQEQLSAGGAIARRRADMLNDGSLRERLLDLGLSLPPAPQPRGNYVPAMVDDGRLWVSGHTGRTAGSPAERGVVGRDVTVAAAQRSAQLATVNLLAAAAAVVPIERLTDVLMLRGYVRAAEDFVDHPSVIDAGSRVLSHVFGGNGHARAALGVASLPGGACVELEAVFALR